MGKRKQLSEREKGKIDVYYKELNISKTDIARRIRRSIHCVTREFIWPKLSRKKARVKFKRNSNTDTNSEKI